MMKFSKEIEESVATLKDFQQATVTHVVGRMSNGQKKFLIADEVGLGKTIVAKGVIVKLYEKEFDEDRDFNVIYICSNLALAKQNLSKLNPFKSDQIIDYSAQDDRLTSLAYEQANNENEYRLKIRAFTPATSFDNKTSAGRKDERALLYWLLRCHKDFKSRRTALEWFLKGNMRISTESWRKEINYVENRVIREDVYDKFHERLKEPLPETIRHQLFPEIQPQMTIVEALLYFLLERKQNRSFEDGKDDNYFRYYRRKLIPLLRLQLSHVCKEYLRADLFILDEFQRFSQLIKTKETPNEGEEIARAIFSQADARVLLLSATPFKPYTNKFDEMQGEHHYTEFKTVLEFLNLNKPEGFWEKLETDNRIYFHALKNAGQGEFIETIIPLKKSIEQEYRGCMARTERIIVEQCIQNEEQLKNLSISSVDVGDYIAIDKIILANNEEGGKKLPDAIEYVKSSPFPLSFLQDYDHHKVLKATCQKSDKLKKLVRKSKKAFLPLDRIAQYKALLPEKNVGEPNPKLRLLYDETVRNNGYKLLWIPPSISYYKPAAGSVYHKNEQFTKTLIFSSWKLVPRMVSALVSYEAERLSIGKYYEKQEKEVSYFVKGKEHRDPKPLLTFRRSDDKGFSGMNNYMLIYPSIYLASLYNPAKNLIERKKLPDIKESLKCRIEEDLKGVGALTMGSPDGDWQKWYWHAVLLLDKHSDKTGQVKNWLAGSADDDESEDQTAREKHLEQIRDIMLRDTQPLVGTLTEGQLKRVAEFLADLCLGAPGVTAYRTLTSVYGANNPQYSLSGAKMIADGFISLFNKPESIAIVKNLNKDDHFYYENVLNYCVDGNIQSMLDEYVHQLYDSCGYRDMSEAAVFIRDVLRINAGAVEVVTSESLRSGVKGKILRTHYAVPFGMGGNDLQAGKRQIKVREAFNSPFRPFVLTSTSIGQEGLDFHLYCSKIIHWNLPGNPIDLEQREGRIKRYKSLLIRRNVMKKHAFQLTATDTDGNIWDSIFEYAQEEKNNCDTPCDLIPYWHINDENGAIKSLIPIYPFSKDIGKYRYIKQVLVNYRLTFGQPRQEELVFALQNLDSKKYDLKKLLLNLSPVLSKE